MAYSELLYTGDGSTTDWDVTFDYLDQSHIVVAVDKVLTTSVGSDYAFEFIDSNTVRVRTVIGLLPVPIGLDIRIARQTPIDTPAVVFGGGASLTSNNLNKNSQYLTYALQEATDANDAFTTLYLGDFPIEPTTDNDGNALIVGALYYDSALLGVFTWTGSEWIAATGSQGPQGDVGPPGADGTDGADAPADALLSTGDTMTGPLIVDTTLSVTGTIDVANTIAHTGDTNTNIAFLTDQLILRTGGAYRLDVTNSGMQLGAANARVTTILDEDAMGSDSATALATQQSIKALSLIHI